ncbi:MAG: TIGR01212 family radical SAM protein [Lachnospiraceae bacterium]|nr:TIGR01212 family radical SAM protein [Lachnospiraceae bacterium]
MQDLSDYLKKEFGEKVYRLSLSSGCSCPNRDGKIGTGGCSFCSEGGSGEFAAAFRPIQEQMEEAKKRIISKTSAKKFIAYFQSYTNTYGDPLRLKQLYQEALIPDDIVALSLGTRPDCLDDAILEMLSDLQKIKPVWIELGLQTIHEHTAKNIRRGYSLAVFEKAYLDLKDRNIPVIVHVIMGLPGETKEDMLETITYLSKLSPSLDGIKIQNLQVLKNTDIGRDYEKNPFHIMSLEEYSDLLVECEKILPASTVLHRMTGDGPRNLLIEPQWSLNKKHVLNTLRKKRAKAKNSL